MNAAAMAKQLELMAATVTLAESARAADFVDIRHTVGDVNRNLPSREVVFTFSRADQAQSFLDAMKSVNAKM